MEHPEDVNFREPEWIEPEDAAHTLLGYLSGYLDILDVSNMQIGFSPAGGLFVRDLATDREYVLSIDFCLRRG